MNTGVKAHHAELADLLEMPALSCAAVSHDKGETPGRECSVNVQVLTGMFSRTTGHIDDRWQAFMKFQIARARQYFADAEAGVDHLDTDARWPVWSALILYRYCFCAFCISASVFLRALWLEIVLKLRFSCV